MLAQMKAYRPLWHYRMIDFGESIGELTDTTQYMRVRSSIDADKIRVRLDNRYNKGKLVITQIRAAAMDAAGKVMEEKKLLIGGADGITLQPEEKAVTDETELSIVCGGNIVLAIHLEKAEGITGICKTWSTKLWESWFVKAEDPEQKLDCTQLFPILAEDSNKPWAEVGVSQIDVLTDKEVKTIAMFGDSITHMSYYSDAVFERILAEYPGKAVIANCGIGGNRLCYDYVQIAGSHGNNRRYGPAGKDRFEEDVYADMSPEIVLALMGTNDCNHGPAYGFPEEFPTLEEFQTAQKQVIDCAHEHGSRIYTGTIMPFHLEEWEHVHAQGEKKRQELNQWIRTQHLADGMMDFALAAEDPTDSDVLQPGFDVGDGLHPGTVGGKIMASIVPLEEVVLA